MVSHGSSLTQTIEKIFRSGPHTYVSSSLIVGETEVEDFLLNLLRLQINWGKGDQLKKKLAKALQLV